MAALMYSRQAPSEATKTAALVEGTAELPVLLGLVVVAVVGEVVVAVVGEVVVAVVGEVVVAVVGEVVVAVVGEVVVAVVGEVEPVGGGINWAPERPWRDGQD